MDDNYVVDETDLQELVDDDILEPEKDKLKEELKTFFLYVSSPYLFEKEEHGEKFRRI